MLNELQKLSELFLRHNCALVILAGEFQVFLYQLGYFVGESIYNFSDSFVNVVSLGSFEVFELGISCYKICIKKLYHFELQALFFNSIKTTDNLFCAIERSQTKSLKLLIESFCITFNNLPQIQDYNFLILTNLDSSKLTIIFLFLKVEVDLLAEHLLRLSSIL